MFIEKIFAKQLLACLIAGSFLFLGWNTVQFIQKHTPSHPGVLPDHQADVQINTFFLTQSREGERDWDLKADEARVYENASEAVLEGIWFNLHGSKPRLSFEADKGTLNLSTNDLMIERLGQPLDVFLENGYRIQAPSLHWMNQLREIHSDGPVTIVGPKIEIQGNRLALGADTGDFQVTGNVQAKLQ